MRAKLTLLSALAFGTLVGAIASGCQSYDFEPVEPLALAQTTYEESINARSSKPNIMLLVDTSGSMTFPVNPSLPACQVTQGGETYTCGGQLACPSSCPTRWRDLQAAVPQFLASSGPFVRFGLTTYPSGNEPNTNIYCAAAVDSTVRKPLPSADDDATLLAHANSINDIIQGIPNSGPGQPEGGTPTSGSLNFVGNLQSLLSEDRKDFVILLTDGLPNCNKDNPNTGSTTDDSLCRCTLLPDSQCSGSFLRRGCLDQDASVSAVRALKDKNITTIVIGFGAETATGNGQAVLGAMAEAGGFGRKCDAQGSCGAGDTCDQNTGLCGRAFYQAGNQAELATALEAISKELVDTNPCLIELDPNQVPSDPKLIVVYVDGQRVAAGADTWDIDVAKNGGVLFTGGTCQRILASTPQAPVNVEVRAIRQR